MISSDLSCFLAWVTSLWVQFKLFSNLITGLVLRGQVISMGMLPDQLHMGSHHPLKGNDGPEVVEHGAELLTRITGDVV